MWVGIGRVRVRINCEAMAPSASRLRRGRGMWKCVLAKNAMRACMAWWALGDRLVHIEQSLCWKKEVGVLEGERRHSAQNFALMSGLGIGGEGSRWEKGVWAAEDSHVKHIVQMCVNSPCLSQLYPWGVVVPHISQERGGEESGGCGKFLLEIGSVCRGRCVREKWPGMVWLSSFLLLGEGTVYWRTV